MQELWVGHDFVFGHHQEGIPSVLNSLSLEHGFTLYRIPPVVLDDQPVSSRRTRESIANGDLVQASKCLGRRVTMGFLNPIAHHLEAAEGLV